MKANKHIVLTNHAKKRLKERLGKNDKDALTLALKAYADGSSNVSNLPENIKKIMFKKSFSNYVTTIVKYYNNSMWIFQKRNEETRVLLTVYEINEE